MTQRYNTKGFTLVELMTAMAFVAFLLLVIAGVVIQMSNIYNKGVTMAAVNQAGRAVVTDMKRTFSESQPLDLTTAYVQQLDTTNTRQIGGRLCTGAYTYVWNIGTGVKTDPVSGNVMYQANNYDDGTPVSGGFYTPLRFVKIRDAGGQYCAKDPTTGALAKTTVHKSDATELFADTSIMVQCFQINKTVCTSSDLSTPTRLTNVTSGLELYTISMLISNADKQAIDTSDNCVKPSEDAVYQNYCAVNEFDFTVHAGNNGG